MRPDGMRARFRSAGAGRLGWALAIGALFGLFAVATSGALAQGSSQNAAARFVKADCPQTPAVPKRARCGKLIVPENRAKPTNGRTIKLTVAIVPPDKGVTPKRDPIVWLAGGPGDDALIEIPWALAGNLNSNRDVIFMSQRGTFSARPRLLCREVDRLAGETLDLPYDSAEAGRAAAEATRSCLRRLRSRGIDLAAYNSIESAHDLEDLRRALRIDAWNIYGISYGTDLALTYMRMHPKGIRSVGIDGIFPPSLAGGVAAWRAAGEGINTVFAACAAQPDCDARYPDLAGTFTRLVRQYEHTPWTVDVDVPGSDEPVKVTISGGMLVQWAVSPGTHLAAELPAAIDALANGDPERIVSGWARGRLDPAGIGILGQGLFYGISCREWVPFETEAEVVESGRRAFPDFPVSVLRNAPNLPFMRQNCDVWNLPSAPNSIRSLPHSRIPTLVLSAQYDGQTAASNGAYVARRLANSVAVTIPNVAHVAFASPSPKANACAQRIVRSFFNVLTDVDTSCTASVPPTRFIITPEPASAHPAP